MIIVVTFSLNIRVQLLMDALLSSAGWYRGFILKNPNVKVGKHHLGVCASLNCTHWLTKLASVALFFCPHLEPFSLLC